MKRLSNSDCDDEVNLIGSDFRNKTVGEKVFQKLFSVFVLVVLYEIEVQISCQKCSFTCCFDFWKKWFKKFMKIIHVWFYWWIFIDGTQVFIDGILWDFLVLYKINFPFTTSETMGGFTSRYGIYELPHEFPNYLKLRILLNYEKSKKCLIFIKW